MSQYLLSNQDAVTFLRTLADESIDLIITDPPYESLEKHRAKGTTTRLKVSKGSSNQWFEIFPNDRFQELFTEIYRVLKKNAHFYLFCDQETMFVAKPLGEQAGFTFWKPIIWDKVNIGMGYHYRARYETILFFEKGKRRLNNLGIADILTARRVYKGFPTEKPVAINQTLIEQSSIAGEIVLDPFCGSGSLGVAALETGRNVLLNDLSSEAIKHTAARLAKIEGATEQKTDESICL